MPAVQTTYATSTPIGLPGMIVNSEPVDKFSATLQGADLPFGQPVLRGTLDRTCILASQETYQAASAAVAGNTGNGTMGAITVSTGAKLGVYKLTVIAAAANAGNFTVEDPQGITVDNGAVASAFSSGGLAFTLADGATDFAAGDQFTITVTATGGTDVGDFVGLSVMDTTLNHTTADVYQAADNVAIMGMGIMWVTAGATLVPGDPVYWNPATKRYTKTTTHLAIPSATFISSAVDGGMIRVALKLR